MACVNDLTREDEQLKLPDSFQPQVQMHGEYEMHLKFTLHWHGDHSLPISAQSHVSLDNQIASTVKPEQSTVECMPIIQAPVSNPDSSNTTVQIVFHVAQSKDQ